MTKYYYRQTVTHEGLNKHRIIKAPNRRELKNRVALLENQWDEEWRRKQEVASRRLMNEQVREEHADNQEEAIALTYEAEEKQKMLESILENDFLFGGFDWDTLKNFENFDVQKPVKPQKPEPQPKPERSDFKYNKKLGFIKLLSKDNRERNQNENLELFNADVEKWSQFVESEEQRYQSKVALYEGLVEKWKHDKLNYDNERELENKNIDLLREKFSEGNQESIEVYFQSIIDELIFPVEYSRDSFVEYNVEGNYLIVDLKLPTIEDLPTIKEVKYIKSRKEFKEVAFSKTYIDKLYEKVIYSLVLVVLKNIFISDNRYNYVESVIINGFIETVDLSTGLNHSPFILSTEVKKSDFEIINLANIDPKEWFRKNKGISATKLTTLTPVAPIARINREDDRFVDGYEIINTMDDDTNLASLDWMDFENLIRELFEKEFNSNGGEVKITQASRDGGVDAVAFDPDPLKGGKIIIQAKRYTNVVGVSAVRDLYGTLLNEGANKGILVTTSNYGADSYGFAKDKPITLINGSELLYMLQKHGHKVKIDLEEARKLMK
ncbi:restriction endonuclease [Erysipelothrix sp. strain 2 (EsS2-6-Brazil)]|uniref:restriction endonuclease n=1 Tax=Erysipelothrix sp. strain 2 (EsS2-6-Brazil) TaxID=2500549 RepID=UPI00190D3204|nr:restriction endonuclease [Erysipelothrix sp. strain 2 (EsS2-6-Brazil)]